MPPVHSANILDCIIGPGGAQACARVFAGHEHGQDSDVAQASFSEAFFWRKTFRACAAKARYSRPGAVLGQGCAALGPCQAASPSQCRVALTYHAIRTF